MKLPTKLPIELIPNSDPPRFRWTQQVETLIGLSDVVQSGTVPLSLESSLIALIKLCETMNKRMYGKDGLMAVLAACSERNKKLQEELDKLSTGLDQLPMKPKPVQVPTANSGGKTSMSKPLLKIDRPEEPPEPTSSPKKPKG